MGWMIRSEIRTRKAYALRAPRTVPFNADWRRFAAVRFGLVMMNVPEPRYSALYRFSLTLGSDFLIANLTLLLRLFGNSNCTE